MKVERYSGKPYPLHFKLRSVSIILFHEHESLFSHCFQIGLTSFCCKSTVHLNNSQGEQSNMCWKSLLSSLIASVRIFRFRQSTFKPKARVLPCLRSQRRTFFMGYRAKYDISCITVMFSILLFFLSFFLFFFLSSFLFFFLSSFLFFFLSFFLSFFIYLFIYLIIFIDLFIYSHVN